MANWPVQDPLVEDVGQEASFQDAGLQDIEGGLVSVVLQLLLSLPDCGLVRDIARQLNNPPRVLGRPINLKRKKVWG